MVIFHFIQRIYNDDLCFSAAVNVVFRKGCGNQQIEHHIFVIVVRSFSEDVQQHAPVIRHAQCKAVGDISNDAVCSAEFTAPAVAGKCCNNVRLIHLQMRRKHTFPCTGFAVQHHDLAALRIFRPRFYLFKKPGTSDNFAAKQFIKSSQYICFGQTEQLSEFSDFTIIFLDLVTLYQPDDLFCFRFYVLIKGFLPLIEIIRIIAHIAPLVLRHNGGRCKRICRFQQDCLNHTMLGAERNGKLVPANRFFSCRIAGQKSNYTVASDDARCNFISPVRITWDLICINPHIHLLVKRFDLFCEPVYHFAVIIVTIAEKQLHKQLLLGDIILHFIPKVNISFTFSTIRSFLCFEKRQILQLQPDSSFDMSYKIVRTL